MRVRHEKARFLPICPLLLPAPSGLDMEDADQRKEPPCGGEVGFGLALERVEQRPRAAVVDRAACHVERLDLLRRGLAHRLVVRIADREILAHVAAEAGETEPDSAGLRPLAVAQL